MGYTFEHLIFKFAESSNETAGEHFTPREVIKLMVHLLFADDSEIFKEGIIRRLYDPACGTGGMLSEADEYFREHNPDKSAVLQLFGQELNPESYAICKADMMIKGQDPANIKIGNSFTEDGLDGERFDYLLSNPPSGVDWIGDVPEHWEVKRLRYTSKIVRGASPRPVGSPLCFNGDHTAWITVAELTKDDENI